MSSRNKKDIIEIKEDYIKNLNFHYVDNIKEVFDLTLQKNKYNKAQNWIFIEQSPANNNFLMNQ